METQKNLSLLRPFNLELAKAGEPFARIARGELYIYNYLIGPDSIDFIVSTNAKGEYIRRHVRVLNNGYYFMAPLTWIEGKPVYKGDVLYWKPKNRKVTIDYISYGSIDYLMGTDNALYFLDNLTWKSPTPPAPKPITVTRVGYINVYRDSRNDAFHTTRETADVYKADGRIDCLEISYSFTL